MVPKVPASSLGQEYSGSVAVCSLWSIKVSTKFRGIQYSEKVPIGLLMPSYSALMIELLSWDKDL